MALAASLGPAGCDDVERPPSLLGTGAPWPEADALFRREPRWLGGDGAYSCELGGGRVLWLFGDSFVAKTPANVRAEANLVRNSLAVQTGLDPVTAGMAFAWSVDEKGEPSAFFPSVGDRWHWPGGCVRAPGGPLVVFLSVLRPSSGGLGFEAAGFRLARIDDPDAPPATWKPTYVDPPADVGGVTLGTAVAAVGDGVHVLGIAGDDHEGRAYRFVASSLASDPWSGATAWNGSAYGPLAGAAVMLDDAGAEASWHPWAGLWLHVASRGFGATTVAIRTAGAPEGPWSDQADVYTPEESAGLAPFVYAAKAHPELATGDGTLAVTYATNSFTFADLFTPAGEAHLYWPRFVRLRLTPR